MAVFFAFDHAGVTGEELARAEDGFEVGAVHAQGTGQAEGHGAGLAALATAFDADEGVDAARHLGGDQRRPHAVALKFFGEVSVDLLSVDLDDAGSLADAHAGHRGLAPAGAPDELLFLGGGHRGLVPRAELGSRLACRVGLSERGDRAHRVIRPLEAILEAVRTLRHAGPRAGSARAWEQVPERPLAVLS